MPRNLRSYSTILLFIFITIQSGVAKSISIFTEYLPPYQFIENGKISGHATSKVKKILQCAKLKGKFYLYPWARSFQQASEIENSLIYSMQKQPERINDFHWIGILIDEPVSLYRLKKRNDIVFNSMAQLRNYHLGLYNMDFATEYFKKNHFKENKHYTLFNNLETQVKMLLAGRFDITVGIEGMFEHYIKYQLGLEPDEIVVKIKSIDLRYRLYLAANKQMPDDIVQSLTQCHKKLFDIPLT